MRTSTLTPATSALGAARRRAVLGAGALALLAIAGVGCPSADGAPTEAVCPDDSDLTYANFGQEFMEQYCLECHSVEVTGDDREGAPDDHNFDVLDDIRAMSEHIDELAGSGPASTNRVMPTVAPRPTVAEREQLSEWLACGAP